MSSLLRHVSLIVLPAFFLAGCASSDPEKTYTKTGAEADSASVSMEAKQAAAQVGTAQVVEVKFARTKTALTAAESAKIPKALEKADKAESSASATIVCWSDSEMPGPEAKDLPETAVNLADARCGSLEKILESQRPKMKVSKVNMAQRPDKISKFLKTKDARIQEALEIAGVPQAGEIRKKKGDVAAPKKASTAILIFSK